MKKIILSALCLLPLGLMAQQTFTVKGKVGSLNEPAKAFIAYRVGKTNVIDSAVLKNGAFEFKGNIDGPTQASLRIKHDAAPIDTKKRVPLDVLPVFLENATIVVTAPDSIKHGKITGSKLNDENAKYTSLFTKMDAEVANLMKQYNSFTPEQKKDSVIMKPFMEKYTAANKDREPLTKKFAEENRNSYIGLIAFRASMGYDIDPKVVEPEFLKYSQEVRATNVGKSIQEAIDGAKRSQVGAMAADFTQFDPTGKSVKLSDFKGKYVLVDFWASWCGPCRAENPNVLAAYNKYKSKNFEILGVSIDEPTKKAEWLQAVKQDGLTWTQVSDTKEGGNTAANLYGVNAIPFNFIIDPTGKVVAKNLRGDELEKKLAELLDKKTK
jgi:peroxiredoxin